MATPKDSLPLSFQSRGLLAGVDEAALKARVQGPAYRPLWAQMAAAWRVAADRVARGDRPTAYGSLAWHSISPMAVEAALLHRWGGDSAALEYVRQRAEHLARLAADPSRLASLPGKKHPIHSNWELALAADLCREAIAGPVLDGLLRAFRTQAIDCHEGTRRIKNYGAGANIPLAQVVTAGIVALIWGQDCGHPEWERVVDLARDACIVNLRYAFDANGYPYEGSAYGHVTLFHIYLYAQLLLQNGRDDLFASQPVLGLIPQASRNVMLPDRSGLINTNDHGLSLPWSLPWLLLTARHYRRPADLALWHEYQGPEHPLRPFGFGLPWAEAAYPGHPRLGDENYHEPTHALTLLWWDAAEKPGPVAAEKEALADYSAGVETANFRTSWSRDAVYLNVPGGGRSHGSFGHAHADCGHFSIFAHGEYLAVDTGRYNTDEDQHNVVLVDGQCFMPTVGWGYSKRAGRLSRFQHHDWLDYTLADAAALKNCIWADRHILFVRMNGDDAYVVTLDNLNPDGDPHSFWWQLQAGPSCEIRLEPEQRRASVVAAKARLDVSFILPRPEDLPGGETTLDLRQDMKDWSYSQPAEKSPHIHSGLMISSARRPRLIAEWAGARQMMAVMAPRRAGQAPLAVRATPLERIFHVDIEWAGGVDTIIAALDHGYIDIPGVRGFTELAVIRRDAGGRVAKVWTVDGSKLALS